MTELILPTTDGGVAAQIAVVVFVLLAALGVTWKKPDVRLLVIGVGLTAFGFIGIRALH